MIHCRIKKSKFVTLSLGEKFKANSEYSLLMLKKSFYSFLPFTHVLHD